MNMDFNTVTWTGLDDDTVRLISSFTLMHEIQKLVDNERFKFHGIFQRKCSCSDIHKKRLFMY